MSIHTGGSPNFEMKDDVRTEMNNVTLAALEAQKANPENAMDVSAALFPTCVALLAASSLPV
jgi:hypothetical protein